MAQEVVDRLGRELAGQHRAVAIDQLDRMHVEEGAVLTGEAEQRVLADGARSQRDAPGRRALDQGGIARPDGVDHVEGHGALLDHGADLLADAKQVVVLLDVDRRDALRDARLEVVGVDEPLVRPGADGEAVGHREAQRALELAELGVLAADAQGAVASERVERNGVVVLRDRPLAGQQRLHLRVDGAVARAQRLVRLAPERDHPLDDGVDPRLDVGDRGADVIRVEEVLALRLLLHVGDDLEHQVVLLEQGQEVGEPVPEGVEFPVRLPATGLEHRAEPLHGVRSAGDASPRTVHANPRRAGGPSAPSETCDRPADRREPAIDDDGNPATGGAPRHLSSCSTCRWPAAPTRRRY